MNETPVNLEVIGPTVVATIVVEELTANIASEVRAQIVEVVNQNPTVTNIVFDLQSVQYLDSACLDMMVGLHLAVKNLGGRVAVAQPPARIEALFKLTRLDQVFPIRRDVFAAIAAAERAA